MGFTLRERAGGRCMIEAMHDADDARTGWVGYTSGPGGKDHLPPDVRAAVDRQEQDLDDRRGRLLCEVHVQVYEHDVDDDPGIYVTFSANAALGPDSDAAEVAAAVARARDKLGSWQ